MSEEIDLSQFDDIADRVERAKAKAAAVRAAKGGGGGSAPAPAAKAAEGGEAPADAEAAPAKKSAAGRAAAARSLTGDGGGETQIVVQITPAPPAIRPGPGSRMPGSPTLPRASMWILTRPAALAGARAGIRSFRLHLLTACSR